MLKGVLMFCAEKTGFKMKKKKQTFWPNFSKVM